MANKIKSGINIDKIKMGLPGKKKVVVPKKVVELKPKTEEKTEKQTKKKKSIVKKILKKD